MADSFLHRLGGFVTDVIGGFEQATGIDIPLLGPGPEEDPGFIGPPSPFPPSPLEVGTTVGGFLGDIAEAIIGGGLGPVIFGTESQPARPDRPAPPITERREETIPPPGERDLGDLGALLRRGLGIPQAGPGLEISVPRGAFPDPTDEAIMAAGEGGGFRGVGASGSFEIGGGMADLVAQGPRASIALTHPSTRRLPHRVQVRHPVTGRPVTYENMGVPILFSGHLRAARKVRKVAALAKRKSR